MQFYTIDGACMTDRKAAHAHLKTALRLPDYYGGNLDALYDCLTEGFGDAIVMLRHESAMRVSLGRYADSLLRVMRDAARESGLRFFVDPSYR